MVAEAVPGPERRAGEHGEHGQEPVEILDPSFDDVPGDRDEIWLETHQLLENRPEHFGVEEGPRVNVAQEQDPKIVHVARPGGSVTVATASEKRRGRSQQYGCHTPRT